MKLSIDLNADLGEDETPEGVARDLAMMDIVSSCNIACGGHAGSAENMRRMLDAAKTNGVSAGAHPSYPDRDNFGRVSMDITRIDLEKKLREQMDVIMAIALEVGTGLVHLKPHGSLYNDAQDSEDLSNIIAKLAVEYRLTVVGMDHSILEQVAISNQVKFIAEAFIDRRYLANGRLTPRSRKDAIIASDDDRLKQGLALAQGNRITDEQGTQISISAQTLCLHSDSQGALATAGAMKAELEKQGYVIEAPNP